jgi:hypothetical protein
MARKKRGSARKEAAKRMRSEDASPAVPSGILHGDTSPRKKEPKAPDPYKRTVQRNVAESDEAPKGMRRAAARGQSMKAFAKGKELRREEVDLRGERSRFRRGGYDAASKKRKLTRGRMEALEQLQELKKQLGPKPFSKDFPGPKALEKARAAHARADKALDGALDRMLALMRAPDAKREERKSLKKYTKGMSEKAHAYEGPKSTAVRVAEGDDALHKEIAKLKGLVDDERRMIDMGRLTMPLGD